MTRIALVASGVVVYGLSWATMVGAQSQVWGEVNGGSSGLAGVTVELSGDGLRTDDGVEVTSSIGYPAHVQPVALTNQRGRYGFTELRAGTYNVSFTSVGHDTVIVEAVALRPNSVLRLDVEMQAGAVEATVTFEFSEERVTVGSLAGRSAIVVEVREYDEIDELEGVDVELVETSSFTG